MKRPRASMRAIYQAVTPTIEDLIRYGVIKPGEAKAERRTAVSHPTAAASGGLAEQYAQLVSAHGMCKAIRMLTAANPEVPVKSFIASLPTLKPSTIRVHYRKAKGGGV